MPLPDAATLQGFGQAMLVGLSIAAPVGPIGLLTIQRTLERGRGAGLATGLGAAMADACYGALGAFGVSFAIQWLVGLRVPLALVGGAVLLWMAWQTWPTAQRPVAERAASVPGAGGLLGCFAGTFLLTLSNPATILSFIAVFGALAGSSRQPLAPGWMVLGVGLGSALWWWLLTALVSRLRSRFDDRWRLRINQASALVLAGFALWQWVSLAVHLWSG